MVFVIDTDTFQMIVDTYRDRQNGFVFGTNPAGIEYDGQVTNEGQGGGGLGFGSMQSGGSGSGFNINQPTGTPTWIDLGIPDLDRAMAFYRPLFGWEFHVGPAEVGRHTMCLLDGKPVAALMPNADSGATEFWWNM